MLSLGLLVPRFTQSRTILFCRKYSTSIVRPAAQKINEVVANKSSDVDPRAGDKQPIKFTKSSAYIDYRATDNFYSPDDPNLPKSHNLVLCLSFILSLTYLIFLRDDIESDGGKALFQPLHETVPELAIPLLQTAIAENRKFGNDTKKLEKKLADYMKDPEKHGMRRPKLVEN